VRQTHNANLALIFQETMKNDTLLSADYANTDTEQLAQTILDGMSTKTVSETSFDSRVPSEQR
jgi:hypothetical protein